MHEEVWVELEMFPGYSVSDTGFARNDTTGQFMTPMINQRGIVNVGLTKDRVQYKRALATLVAEAFCVRPSFAFGTPMHLDGNRTNNRADNLVWRPRWFLTYYYQQLLRPTVCVPKKVQEIETGDVFTNSWEAAITLGALDRDIAFSIYAEVPAKIIRTRFKLFK